MLNNTSRSDRDRETVWEQQKVHCGEEQRPARYTDDHTESYTETTHAAENKLFGLELEKEQD